MFNIKSKFLIGVASILMLVSSVSAKDVSAYLVGSHQSVDSVKSNLAKAGFEVVTEYESVKDGVTVVFTNAALKKEGAKPMRAHAAVLRAFVDNKEKKISITNPVYFGNAFMQDDYNAKVFEAQLASINSVFSGLTGSIDKLDSDDLEDYRFMFGMPYYDDVDELGEGSTADLLKKAKTENLLFTLKLSEKSYLLGYDLSAATKEFVNKVGRANAAVLPYCISIEDGKATSLEGKYYLAVSYPLLSMGQFTTISDIPGAIADELKKPFN